MFNVSFGKSEGSFATQSGSDGVADLNPDDIESINMLTGPSAAALYGNAAANGVVLINTFRSVLREIRIAVRLNNGNDDNRGTQSLGKIGRGFKRFIREFGSVCRNQNTVIHS